MVSLTKKISEYSTLNSEQLNRSQHLTTKTNIKMECTHFLKWHFSRRRIEAVHTAYML